MRTMKLAAAVFALLLAGAMLTAPPASAHGVIPRGEYPCYTYDSSFHKVYTGYSLWRRGPGKYALVKVGHWVKYGTFVHPRRGPGLRWTSGYLHRTSRGYHMYNASIGMNVIEILWNQPRNGEDYFDCFK